jgi:hypothetical protein
MIGQVESTDQTACPTCKGLGRVKPDFAPLYVIAYIRLL